VGWSEAGEPIFYRPAGRALETAPALPRLRPAIPTVGDFAQWAPAGGVASAAETTPSWEGGAVDYQWALDRIRGFAARTMKSSPQRP
jgi:hypothetical protein